MNKPKIFFSYSRFDSSFALKLAKDLRDSGSDVWIDQIDIQAGKHWDAAVEKALDSSSCVIVILTPTSIVSENVMDEVSFALESGKRIIPVMLVECPTPFRLRRLQRVDFTTDYEAGFIQLKKSIYPSQANTSQIDTADSYYPVADSLNTIVGTEVDDQLWEQASEVNTISSYKKYLVESVTGSYAAEAQLMVKQLELEQKEDEMEIHLWQKAKTKNSLSLYQNYLQAYPNGNFKPLALAAIADLELKNGKTGPSKSNGISVATRKKINAFKKVAVLGTAIMVFCFVIMSFIKMSSGNEELKAWNEALLKNDSLAYAMFRQKFPNGEYSLQAKRKSDSIGLANQVIKDSSMHVPASLVMLPDTTQVIEKPKTDSLLKGAAVTKPKTNNVKAPASFKPGQHYQGGIIIYVTSTGDHGLIASVKEEAQVTWEAAMRKSASFKSEGYSDWRLPTKAELNRMYNARKHFEKPLKGLYWSSTEENENTAWVQNLTNGQQANSSKDSHLQMKVVRTF